MKYQIITYGCQMNKSDSERIATILESIGYQPASKENEADLIVVNMCSVRQSAVDRVFGLSQKLSKLKIKNKKLKILLTGCVLKEDRKKFQEKFNLILNIKNLPKWSQELSKISAIENKSTRKITEKPVPEISDRLFREQGLDRQSYLKVQPKYQNNFRAFIPISNGCNLFCSYCVVPYVRGPLVCRDHQEILKEVKEVMKKGIKEIWLLGQNVNDYVSRINTNMTTNNTNISGISAQIRVNSRVVNFAKLLKMINDIPGDFKFFFTSPHPQNFSNELIHTLAECRKFGRYLNLPLQSGDNEILKKMNRSYTVEQYKNLVKKIREKIPDIKLSTDVIVGFPGETKKQFQNTVKLFKEIKFNFAYIAKYSPRPGTVAAKMEDNIPLEEKKRREKILRELLPKK